MTFMSICGNCQKEFRVFPEELPFFEKMQQLKINNNLNDLSMGMSSDYNEALNFGSNYLRIGSAIFK